MSTQILARVAAATAVALSLAACSANDDSMDTTPDLADGELTPEQALTSGSLTITANLPQVSWGGNGLSDDIVRGSFTVTGTGTAKMGVCTLYKAYASSGYGGPVGCTSPGDCTAYVPSGGTPYCARTDNTAGQKYCYIRPGGQADYCAGSPALSGNPAIGAGTYTTPWRAAWQSASLRSISVIPYAPTYYGAEIISYACFGGCSSASPTPSVSQKLVLSTDSVNHWDWADSDT